jgi:hypothetical protein
MDAKYGTSKAQDLRGKQMKKRRVLCMKRAQELGLKDMNKDMFLALICK